MKLQQFRELVREIIREEEQYQAFFKKALEKSGKSIDKMTDDEKKAFFNKIDSTWKAKDENKKK